jgi:hypothetical protein
MTYRAHEPRDTHNGAGVLYSFDFAGSATADLAVDRGFQAR